MQTYDNTQFESRLHRLNQRTSNIKNRIALLMKSDPEDYRIKKLQGVLHRMNTNQRIILESDHVNE